MAKKKASGKKAAKKAPRKKSKKTKVKSAKRELIKPKGDARYVRRNASGEFDESDDVGRSLKADRKKKAKRAAKPGQGDKGDRKKAK
jgi:hypothetical protein